MVDKKNNQTKHHHGHQVASFHFSIEQKTKQKREAKNQIYLVKKQ